MSIIKTAWMLLDDNSLSGGEMMDSESHLNMNGSNLTNAGVVHSNSVSVDGSVHAGQFIGDGSGLTNLQLENGSVLFEHLNSSTLDALVDYISARIVVPQATIGVVASASEPVFELHRMGSTAGQLLVSYTIIRMSGATYTGTAVFADGAEMVLVEAYPGVTLTVNSNPTLYEVDPLNASATLEKVTLSVEIDLARNNQIRFSVNNAVGENFPVEALITHPDGSTETDSWTWGANLIGYVHLYSYGDKVEIVPSNWYHIDSSARSAQLPLSQLSVEIDLAWNNQIRFTRDTGFNVAIPVMALVTHPDGTQETDSWMWGPSIEGYVRLYGYGDKVELVPGDWYEIDPAASEVQLPLSQLSVEIDLASNYQVRFSRSTAFDIPIPVDALVTHADGTQETDSWIWGPSITAYVRLYSAGDRIELVPSIWYDIDPSADWVQL